MKPPRSLALPAPEGASRIGTGCSQIPPSPDSLGDIRAAAPVNSFVRRVSRGAVVLQSMMRN